MLSFHATTTPSTMLVRNQVVSTRDLRASPWKGLARQSKAARCCALPQDDKASKKPRPQQVFNIAGDVHIYLNAGSRDRQSAEWDALDISPDAKALCQKHAVKAATARKMHGVLGFDDVEDLQHLSSDLIALLKLKPLELAPLLNMLQEHVDHEAEQQEHPSESEDEHLNAQAQGKGPSRLAAYLTARAADSGTDRPARVRAGVISCDTIKATGQDPQFWVNSVAISRDGRRAVTACSDGLLRVIDLETHACLASLEGHTDAVHAVVLTPDGSRAVSSSEDGTLRVWDLTTNRCTVKLAPEGGLTDSLALTADGRRVLFGQQGVSSRLPTVCSWDLKSPAAQVYGGQPNTAVRCVAATADRALFGGSDNRLHVYELSTGRGLGALGGHADWVTCVAATDAAGARRAVSGSDDGTLRVWDLGTFQCTGTLKGHGSGVYCVAISPDGRRAVSGYGDGELRVWDLGTHTCLRTMEGHEDPVSSVAFTPDGRHVVSAGDDGTLRVWELPA